MSTPRASAVAGTGFIGPVHVEALRRLGLPVAGILGSTPERGLQAAARLGLPRAYGSFAELLADSSVGVVHIATPNRLHADQCKAALAAGKHVVCEKPLGMDSAETADLVRVARASGLVAAVCYNTRYYARNQEARRRAATLGRLFHVTGAYLQDWLLLDTDFNWRVAEGEGGASRALADIGTHWLDLVQHVTGRRVVSLCADLATVHAVRRRPAGPVETFRASDGPRVDMPVSTEDAASLLLRFEGGASGCLTVSQVAAGRKNQLRWEASFADGSLAWDGERPEELWLGRRGEANASIPREPGPFSDYPPGHAEGFPDTFKHLFRAVYARIDGGEGEYPPFADGHAAVRLVEAALASARGRCWMDVPE